MVYTKTSKCQNTLRPTQLVNECVAAATTALLYICLALIIVIGRLLLQHNATVGQQTIIIKYLGSLSEKRELIDDYCPNGISPSLLIYNDSRAEEIVRVFFPFN